MLTLLLCTGAAASPTPRDPLRVWVGHWQTGDRRIDIDAMPNRQLAVDGYAVEGGRDPVRVANGAVHLADFSVIAAPRTGRIRFGVSALDGRALSYAADGVLCHLAIRLEGRRLIVTNPDDCGAIGLSFTGVYRWRGPPNAGAQGR